MALADCYGALRGALGERPGEKPATDEELNAILQDLADRAERNGDGDYRRAAQELGDQEAAAAAIRKRNTLINLQTRIDRLARLDQKSDQARGKDGVRRLDLAMESEQSGINTPVRGGQVSAQGDWHALHQQYWGGLTQDLEAAGLVRLVQSRAIEEQWATELSELNKANGKPGITGNAHALAIARIMKKWQDMAKADVNRAGGWIGDYSGYVTTTSHDPDLIREMGFDAWLKLVLAPGFDRNRTFEGIADPQKFMRGIYNAFVTGVHLTENWQGLKDAAFAGPGNMAKRLSEGKVLHWDETPEGVKAWIAYQKQAGTPDIMQTYMAALDRSARSVALMKRWGTNPRAEFDADFRRLAERFRDSDPEAVRQMEAARYKLETRFGFLDGTANMPVNRAWSRAFAIARAVETTAKLGNVLFSHLSSFATKAATLRVNGVNLFQGYGDALASVVRGTKGRGSGPLTIEALHDLKANVLGQERELLSRFNLDDSAPGTVSKLAGSFMKWGGLPYLMNAEKAGTELQLSSMLGRNAGRSLDQLNPYIQRALLKVAIEKPEWDMLRASPGILRDEGNGLTYLTPKAATMIPDAAVEAHLRGTGALADDASEATVARKVGDWRDDLALRLHGYFNEQAERSVVTPGIVERAGWAGRDRPGTLGGEIRRSIAQFKLWPTTVIRQQLGAELYGGQTRTQAARGIAALVVGTTALGYLRMALTDLAAGKVPRDPENPKTWMAAMMQGGGLGIFGDVLFGDYNRFGQNFAETLTGPVIGGGVNAVITLWNDIKAELYPDAVGGKNATDRGLADAWRVVSQHLPFVNLFYTRLAWDYLVNWRIQEFLNPGYLQRHERAVKQQTGQTFWLSPSQAVRP